MRGKKVLKYILVTNILYFIIIEPICRTALPYFHNLPEKSKEPAPLVALHECALCMFGIDRSVPSNLILKFI